MSLLENIKVLSAQRNITIAELERKLNLSQGSIRKWSTINPGIDKVQMVADYFQVSIDELMDRNKKTVDNNILAAHIADDVTPDEMEEILNYINYIKSKR